MRTIHINALVTPEHYGDHHDKPVKWVVYGPGAEVQKFTTKRDAQLYKSIRAKTVSQGVAINAFCVGA